MSKCSYMFPTFAGHAFPILSNDKGWLDRLGDEAHSHAASCCTEAPQMKVKRAFFATLTSMKTTL